MASAVASSLLFHGLDFFLVQRLPQRSKLIADIEAHGGKVVRQEAQADYVLADHARRDAPRGSHSFKFIEKALREGALPSPAQFAAPRPIAAVARTTRTPFTSADDRALWDWVEGEEAAGAAVKGLDIYKRLAEHNPRHTYQAWRDRYLKKLMGARKPPMVEAQASALRIDDIQSHGHLIVQEDEDKAEPAVAEKHIHDQGGSHAVETQDIYNAETQNPDLSMVLPPPDSDGHVEQSGSDDKADTLDQPSESTRLHGSMDEQSSPIMESWRAENDTDMGKTEPDQGELLNTWISTMLVREWSESSCIRALKCTSMRLDLAELVLVTERSGHTLPDNVPGIWSEAEDSVLESGNATALMHLEAKHGWQECESRLKYLEEWREA